ncbi:hypothetical protein NPA31_015040 [Aurantimonas sp. MSK8Z-1]|uniref:hypothetical protein n=1 Tax=Mangrovibrevibacter kandeliae TaxID=2968473 RepID=UPI002118B5BE|nr:hypothetical protein [Aurantimonas sp. MSK8Z-1]MCW4116278.1 hypothetical protein [Aurantimonas sp. MSK8Z-1]
MSMESDPIAVDFGRPDAGWIDFRMSAGDQTMAFPISHAFDPFQGDFRIWLEEIARTGSGKLSIDTEGSPAEIVVIDAGDGRIAITGHPHLPTLPVLQVEADRHAFVHVFYDSLVGFWESPELSDHWSQWVFPEAHVDGTPQWDEDQIAKPWPIRSTIVEEYLRRREDA